MTDMRAWIGRKLDAFENAPLSLASFAAAFAALIIARLLVENALAGFPPQSASFLFFELSHTLLFFLSVYVLFWPLLGWLACVPPRKAALILLFGFLIILTPPVIDRLAFGSEAFWSFYAFDGLSGLIARYFTLFGDNPRIGITYGVRVEVVFVTLAVAAYTWIKTGRGLRALGAGLLSYTLLFVLGTFPSWVTLLHTGWERGFLAVGRADVAALFLTPEVILGRESGALRSVLNHKMSLVYAPLLVAALGTLLYARNRSHFRSLFAGSRPPQLLYHGGLLLSGMSLAIVLFDLSLPHGFFDILAVIVGIVAAGLAWLGSTVVNDLTDTETDKLTNPTRALITKTVSRQEFAVYGLLSFAGSLFLGALVNFSFFFLLLAYQALAYLYSAHPFRLKRYPGIATLLAAGASLLILFGGYLILAPTHDLSRFPLSLALFLLFGYAAVLPVKDFKDIAGDRAEGVFTLPVILGEQKARLFLGALVFLVFAASPMILRFPALILPALLFGSGAFWTIQKARSEDSLLLSYRRLPLFILALVFGYGVTLAILLTRSLS